jgi:hypothetical protein
VSFFLFGQKEHFVEVNCAVFEYYEHSGGSFTCDIALNAKLMSGSSTKICTQVNGLLEGYKESVVPEFYSDDEGEEEEDNEFSDDEEEIFRKEVKKGERVKRTWWHDCYPKMNDQKLDQVKKWLGWDMPIAEFAKVLVDLSMNPSLEGYPKDIETEDHWLNQVERTLDLLFAKIKLKNRIRKEWKKKPKAKLIKAISLVDRSLYLSKKN